MSTFKFTPSSIPDPPIVKASDATSTVNITAFHNSASQLFADAGLPVLNPLDSTRLPRKLSLMKIHPPQLGCRRSRAIQALKPTFIDSGLCAALLEVFSNKIRLFVGVKRVTKAVLENFAKTRSSIHVRSLNSSGERPRWCLFARAKQGGINDWWIYARWGRHTRSIAPFLPTCSPFGSRMRECVIEIHCQNPRFHRWHFREQGGIMKSAHLHSARLCAFQQRVAALSGP